MTYRLVVTTAGDKSYTGIQCLRCGFTSYHPKDVAEKYCGYCHVFHEDPAPNPSSNALQRVGEGFDE
jgi:hypothetical protein